MANGRRLRTALVIMALALLPSCTVGSGADKAGGPAGPVELRLATPDGSDTPFGTDVGYFAQRVAQRSHGAVRVVVTWQVDNADPYAEARVADLVRRRSFDFGAIGARAWDERGVESFSALQAPFLVTNTPLVDRITGGRMGRQMLDGLRPLGLVGLALVPQEARQPAGLQHPFTSIGDFAGARIRDIPSGATDALLQSLGATPIHIGNAAVGEAISHHQLDGEELSLANAPGGMYVTVNITFFEKAFTLFANAASLDGLTAAQRGAVEAAARDTTRHAAVASPSENQLIRRYCTAGHVVVAADSDVAAIERAGLPVYAMLERDPQTRRLIGAIRRMKRTITPPPLVVPAGCGHSAATGNGVERSPAILNGTYRWRFTGQAGVSTATLRDGRWLFAGPDHDMGTYRITGRRLIFDWPRVGSVLTFTFSRDPDGTIHLTPVLPMDPGDQQVWASSSWKRIGPPVAPIP